MDALKAALANGADAAYLGAAAFGARASVGFDEEMLRQALALAHAHRKKIYVTVNIAVKERELSDIRKTLSLLSRLGADAVLVQDLGVLKICREEFPELPLHASTQMALHNAAGVRMLKNLGAQRAVLARECTIDEMRLAAQTGLEIEAFCHGAMCVSVSGQCLFSSMIGGRSGNRGRCAQPCRLNYTYQGQNGAWLSPRDLCARNRLSEMADAGVYSFKIEGRLKRPEYVAVVTRAYRNALDAVQEKRFAPMDEREKEGLIQIFSRGGFSQGYTGEKRDAAIVDPTRVTPVGLPMGKIEKTYQKGGVPLADVRLIRPLHNGDGLEIGRQEIRYSGPEVESGSIATLRLRDAVKAGESVRRTEDESQLAAARATFEGEKLHEALPIPFDAVLTAFSGIPLSLYVTDGESHVSVEGELCQAAAKKPLDAENARRALEKTGGTPFVLREMELQTEGAFAPASALNALRREALEQLLQARIENHPRDSVPGVLFHEPLRPCSVQRLLVKTRDYSRISSLFQWGADEVIWQPRDYSRQALEDHLKEFPDNVRLCLPSQCREETLQMIASLTRKYETPVCVSSPGQLELFPDAMAGEGVPVMNGESIRMLSHLGCGSITLSRELSKNDVLDLQSSTVEMILPAYGRTRLMLLNHCPMRTKMGLEKGKQECRLCEQGKGAEGTCLKDRMGAEYPLLPIRLPEGCLVEMYADQPTHLSQEVKDLPVSLLLSFTDETMDEQRAIMEHYRKIMQGDQPSALPFKGTIGRFHEGVL